MVNLVAVAEPNFGVNFIPFSLISVVVSWGYNSDMSFLLHVNIQFLDCSRFQVFGKVDTEALETVVIVTVGEVKILDNGIFFKYSDLVIVVIIFTENINNQFFNNGFKLC